MLPDSHTPRPCAWRTPRHVAIEGLRAAYVHRYVTVLDVSFGNARSLVARPGGPLSELNMQYEGPKTAPKPAFEPSELVDHGDASELTQNGVGATIFDGNNYS